MNLFFTRKYVYQTADSSHEVKEKLSALTNKSIGGWNNNLLAETEGRTFKVWFNWSLMYITWIERSPAYLTGEIIKEGDFTRLKTTIRPNSLFVLFVYIALAAGFYTIFSGDIDKELTSFYLIAVLWAELLMLSLIFFNTYRLRKRFESFMNVSLN